MTAHARIYAPATAAKVGGIVTNNSYLAQFIRDNRAIQSHVIHAAHLAGVQRQLFLGSSCIYPEHAPQPMKESCLLTGSLEPTNRPMRWPRSPASRCAGATTASSAPSSWPRRRPTRTARATTTTPPTATSSQR